MYIKIPLKVHLHKFISKGEFVFYNNGHLSLNDFGLVTSFINSLLVKKRQFLKENNGEINHDDYIPLKFTLKKRDEISGRVFLSRQSIIEINRFINTLFMHRFEHFIMNHPGLNRRQVLYKFCSFYGIELDVDITYDSFIKKYQRLKKNHAL